MALWLAQPPSYNTQGNNCLEELHNFPFLVFAFIRPSNLPAKTEEEEQRHREEYMAIIAAAKKKEAQNSATRQKLHKQQLRQEEQLAQSAKHFQQNVLPNWDSM